jgi:hypothetical protein
MISKDLIEKCKEIAYKDSKDNGVPSIFQIDYSVEKAIYLAEKLHASNEVVICGAYLMDCMLGIAYALGKLSDHINMSHDKALEILATVTDITTEEKENILHCILEHHGTSAFYSIESEICANADCYKFLSIKGVIGGIKYMRDMELDKVITLYKAKLEEKLAIVSLPLCKEELKSEISISRDFLQNYK